MQHQIYITLWYYITDTKCMMALTLSLVVLHEWVHNNIGLWWWFYNHIRQKSWFLRCLPSVISPVRLKHTRSLVSFAFSYFFLLIHRVFIYLSLSFFYVRAVQYISTCVSPLFYLQQRSLLRQKCYIITKGMIERAPLHATCWRKRATAGAGMAGMPQRWQQCSFRPLGSTMTASRPKPTLEG